MPPSTCTQSWATPTASSRATAAATAAARVRCSGPSSQARAASHATAVIASVRSSIEAQRCLTAWKEPIGLPNCSRTVAYDAAVSRHQRASPAASAASSIAIASRTSWGSSSRSSSGSAPARSTEPTRVDRSCTRPGVTATASADVDVPPPRHRDEQVGGQPGPEHGAALAQAHPEGHRPVGHPPQQVGRLRHLPQHGSRGHRRRERPGDHRGGGRLDGDELVQHRAAPAAERLGQRDPGKAELGQPLGDLGEGVGTLGLGAFGDLRGRLTGRPVGDRPRERALVLIEPDGHPRLRPCRRHELELVLILAGRSSGRQARAGRIAG